MGDFLVFIFTGIFKIIGFLLFKIGMWMPALFTILFFIVLGVTGTDFATISGLYWFGLIATAVIGIVLAIVFAVRKLGKKKPADNNRANQQQVKKTEGEQAKEEDEQPSQPAPSNVPPQPYPYQPQYPGYPPQFTPYYPPYYPQPQQPEQTQGESTTQPYQASVAPTQPYQQQTPPPQRTEFTAQSNGASMERASFDRNFRMPQRDRGEFAARRPSFDEPKREESPRIYRTRKDPSVLVYDYADRVEFYRKTDSGLKYLYTERKGK